MDAALLGWKPKWDKQRPLESMDDEVLTVQELDKVSTSVFDALDAYKYS